MNIAQSKQLLDNHINLASHVKESQLNVDYSQCYGLEHQIILGDNIKDIILALETKMVKRYNIYTILRLIALLCVTQSGLKQAEFDLIRKTFITCYGYMEIPTVVNLQEASLLRLRDKLMDWTKVKKVSKST